MNQGSKLLVTGLIIILALVAGGGIGFFFGQRNPTFNSLPQLIPHISNKTLVELARTSAEIRNVEINAQMDGSVIGIAGPVLTIAKGDTNGIKVVTDNKTTFVQVLQSNTEVPIAFSDLRVGDTVRVFIGVSGSTVGTVSAVKVLRL